MKHPINLNPLVLFSIVFSFATVNTKARDVNIGSMIQPIPKSAKFINDMAYTWCGTLVRSHIDQKYHLFYSRWPRRYGMSAWVTSSEVAHAVSDSPFGPFNFKDVTLPHRDAEYWDGMYTHNPTVHFFNGKYYLYYAGNFGDGKITSPQLNWTHRNNQRIGIAIADDPNGPWKRFDQPIIDISPDTTAHDAQMVANPSVKVIGTNDPHELNDLADNNNYNEIKMKLFNQLLQLQKEMDDPLDLQAVF